MKKVIIILVTALTIAACGGDSQSVDAVIESGNLEAMKAKKEQVLASYDSIATVLGRLELAISEKDTLKKLPLVTTYVLNDTLFNHYIDIQGNVETNENILIYPEYQGLLTKVYVKEGDKVSKGQLLARIDDGGLSSQLSQLETQYQLAKTTFERQERLWNQKIGSEIQYLQAKSNMEASQSSVNQLRSQLGRTSVRAPFSGEIDEIVTEQGQVVAPGGQALMRIVNLRDMYVKASIPENYIGSIQEGTEVKVTFPALNETVNGKVKNVGNYINPNNRTFDIEIDVPNKGKTIKPNLVAKLEINNYSKAKAKMIPANVIQENSIGEKFVYVISEVDGDEAKVTRKKIETGKKYEGQIEVLSGLEDGETIVKDGALTLNDGATVKIKTTN
ncbi:RND family efflux transporter MFP subunit [Ulvibacter sp. MAR_2010_11]|uniref:efflux RND transporter periplasmic adaptor subunit n=1 Tax=Ulvibacter sp. MAR_2010_11 TaxID=1250229 RepID=UPI000C2BA642|nr:efflux RND transporter periplasmic adaptor subunit [Ulvibacter sp. MAR_2010_11]PKA83172.1 RND family efflux transporter MFP subunit [Ulvibacter sp. MAR_2010_11]